VPLLIRLLRSALLCFAVHPVYTCPVFIHSQMKRLRQGCACTSFLCLYSVLLLIC